MYFYFIIISILLPSCLFLEGFLQTGLSQPVTENKAHTKDEKKTARNYFNICRLVCACVCVSMRRSALSIYSGRVSFSTIVMRRWESVGNNFKIPFSIIYKPISSFCHKKTGQVLYFLNVFQHKQLQFRPIINESSKCHVSRLGGRRC